MGSCKVCVTGGAGYIGSALVYSLLQSGYTVHATLRNLGDESKVALLKSFPYAEERLHLFEADIYKPEEFEKAIQGCVFVFHVATPLQHTTGYKSNNTIDATINGAKKIGDVCLRSGTVKRLIYTASVVSASPLKDDGGGYKNTMDESCWTPLHLNVPYTNEHFKDYTISKTKTEQEMLKIGEESSNELEVVTLGCGLVGGGGRLPYHIISHHTSRVLHLISSITNDATAYQGLRYLEELLGKIPIVDIEDVCRAHIFCAETPSVMGRFLCASAYVTSAQITKYCQKAYPQLNQEYLEDHKREIEWGSKKLEDEGFTYEYSTHMILDDCLKCDESKVRLLKSFPNAEENLHLFEADLHKPEGFEKAIQGCVFVFLVAHPLSPNTDSHKSNNIVDATVHGAKKIVDVCLRSGTVKRLIYTASVFSASPIKDDGSGYKNTMDESCWTPLHLNVPYTNEYLKDYTIAKTKIEQEILKIGEEKANEFEVVTLVCGLVGGGGRLPYHRGSVLLFVSQIINDATNYQALRYLEELLGKIPIVHIEDVCGAHIFCAETPSVTGRFLCASAYVTSAQIAKYYQKTYPHLNQEYLQEHERDIEWGSKKLEDKGFTYKYSTHIILDDCLKCANQ
ncbi:hypothetical protein SSX86_027231 [Deinandra increscens subsp. villosa]|uniref:NAD-dependent epimerase/dehydratase domain-containing protein n=1 Tax=Deinandra increscens subsp. villosa TaxID=3103831 RepID=A0AAP0GPS6_9ASTR